MRPRLALAVFYTCALFLAWAAPGFAQGTGSSLSGVAVDADGAIIPGATVVVKNNATGVTFETTTNTSGTFAVPALDAGTYTVTVSLAGFKTAVLNEVRLLTATPASVKAQLEIGAITETVEVRSSAELVQTQSSAVTSTLKVEQMQDLPLSSRNALYFAAFLPGVETAYGSNNGQRQSTFSGLPQNTINITIDGVTTGNNLQSGDGFFSMVTPRLDAVEEVTVTGATPGSTGGSGAVQIAFVTRGGTNQLAGSAYEYFRHPDLNSNYYFNKINNLPKNEVIVHQYGARLGGPIVIPGLFDGRNKAFFFFNMEHQYQPSSATRTRNILNPDAQRGLFRYTSGATTTEVDLLALAARNSQTATFDPQVGALLAQIRASTAITGTVNTPAGATNLQQFVYQAESSGNQWAPTTRIDFNVTDKHRLTGTYYWQRFVSDPDLLNNAEPQFPGFANFGVQQSYRTTGSLGLRSTLTNSMVNEVKGGWQWSPNNFFGNVTADMFGNQGGYQLVLNQGGGINLANPTATNAPAPRNTPNWSIEDTVSWQRGAHGLSFGGNFQRVTHEQNGANAVPSINFGVNQTFDPANAMFTTANFPGASTQNLTDARNLYALLTGRVSSINGTARLDASTGQYVYLGNLYQASRLESYALYGQDSWRLSPTLTLNYGLRWEVQKPFQAVTDTWSTSSLSDLCGVSGEGPGIGGRSCNIFQAGTFGAPTEVSQYYAYSPGSADYETDWNNFAPNVGLAWRPNVQNGWLRRVLGDPEQATIRGGYTKTYSLERMDRFTGLYGANPGGTVAATRDYTTGFPLVLPGEASPVLLRESSRLSAPAFPTQPTYPLTSVISNSINLIAPDIEVPYVHQFSLGFQRALGSDMAFEVRYVGNRNEKAWATENWNERNILENGFLNEFQAAQANLRANVLAGRGGTFRYFGAGSGTSPLPAYLAFFSGLPASRAGDATAYTSTNFANSAWTGHLGYYEPDPVDAANDLHANTTFRQNAIVAGLPSNYFVLNPAVNNANITRAIDRTRYHSLQLDLRRRLADGLLVGANYTYARKFDSTLSTLRRDRFYVDDTDVPHSFKMNWVYQLPVGQGRRFGANMGSVMNAVAGGWEFSGTGRVQTQQYIATNVKLVGMSQQELQDAFQIRTVRSAETGAITVFSLPQDIIDNTRRAYNTDPTSPNHYSGDGIPTGRYLAPASTPECLAIYANDCGVPARILLNGPLFSRFDFRLKKQFELPGSANFELDFEVLNVFDNINFNHQLNPSGNTTAFQVTTAFTDINTTFDPGGRVGQLVFRLNF